MSYRSSIFQSNNRLITTAAFLLKPGNRQETFEKMQDILNKRREKQPLEYPVRAVRLKGPKMAMPPV
jgi:UDP-N-acetylmuramate dehydrogenase